jgi:hypothetical protein
MNTAFRLHGIDRGLTNLALLKYRDWQGFLVTGQHSGTHWIKWMLSHAIAEQYGVAPPRYYNNNSSNEIIGHPRNARIHPHLPRIAMSHSIPPFPLDWRWVRAVAPLPPYAVVIRDVRDVLISNYEKWRERYAVPFSTYVAGDPRGKTFGCDVWWYVRFMNRWGRVAELYPHETLVLRYEDFRADARGSLQRLGEHLGLELDGRCYDVGVAAGSKENMLKHKNPAASNRGVRADGDGDTRFSEADTATLQAILRENLRYDFGYDLFRAPGLVAA